MKYDLSDADKEHIKHVYEHDAVARFIKNKDSFKFKVGDVLIRYNKHYSFKNDRYEWSSERTSRNNKSTRKYLYAFEDEYGIGFLKRISVKTGKPVDSNPISVTSFNPEWTKFELAPEYMEHILLSDQNEKFNPIEDYKRNNKYRKQAIKSNKKLLIKLDTDQEVEAWLKSLSLGDEFWFGRSIDDMVEYKYTVTSVQTSRENGKVTTKIVVQDVKDSRSRFTVDVNLLKGSKFITDKQPFKLYEGD